MGGRCPGDAALGTRRVRVPTPRPWPQRDVAVAGAAGPAVATRRRGAHRGGKQVPRALRPGPDARGTGSGVEARVRRSWSACPSRLFQTKLFDSISILRGGWGF